MHLRITCNLPSKQWCLRVVMDRAEYNYKCITLGIHLPFKELILRRGETE